MGCTKSATLLHFSETISLARVCVYNKVAFGQWLYIIKKVHYC